MIEGTTVRSSFAFHGRYYRLHDSTFGKVGSIKSIRNALHWLAIRGHLEYTEIINRVRTILLAPVALLHKTLFWQTANKKITKPITPRMLRILHLSDLHFDIDHVRDQEILLKALFSDIELSVEKSGPFDIVIFSGDLILKGAYSGDNKEGVVKNFLLPLMEKSGSTPDSLVMVPGNHDIALREQANLLTQARRSLSSEEDVGRYLDDAIKASLQTGLEGFNSIVERLGSETSLVLSNNHYRAYIFTFKDIRIGVAAMNSAWTATGAPNDGDYGRLRLGRKQLDELAQALEGSDLRLAVSHHPISWLTPKDAQNLQRQLLIHFDAFFHGHNHEPYGQATMGSGSGHLISNAGCLYQHRDYFNGYNEINYNHEMKCWRVKAREYYETRQTFDIAPRFSNNGEATFSTLQNHASGAAPNLPTDGFIDAVNTTINSRLLPAHVSDVAPKKLKSIFVEPLLSEVSQHKLDAAERPKNFRLYVSLADILKSREDAIFLGGRDIGKTTLLHRICQLSLELSISELPAFCSYVDLAIAGATQAALIEAVVTFGGGEYRKGEIISILTRGEMAVCFDNVDGLNSKQYAAVKDFCMRFPRCRYFFTMLEDIEFSLSPSQVPRATPKSNVYYFHPFGRRETRLLTQNWFGESSDECSKRVDDILSLLGRLNVPRSPFLISALLWIQEKGTQFAPVNQAEILDALIDGVMEKLSETKYRSRIDSTIKRHYLAALAEHLHDIGTKRIAIVDLEKFTVEYFSSRGLNASTAVFLGELRGKGILLEVGNEVVFMFDAIRAFFLSARLHENEELLDRALSKEHFLQFGEELDYYTGRHRDQSKVLRRALKIVGEFLNEADLEIDLADFDSIRIGRLSTIGDIENQRHLRDATLNAPSSDQREALLESADEHFRCRPVRESSGHGENSAVGRFMEALQVASAILRNSELVRDVDLKEAAYDELARGWCRILIRIMAIFENEEDDEVIQRIDNKKGDPVVKILEGMLPTDKPGMAPYLKKLIIPNVVISIALESIGTPKLQRTIERHADRAMSTVEKVFDCFVMSDLRFTDWPHRLDMLLREFHKNRFVSELIFSKLFQLFMLGRLRSTEEQRVKGLMAEALTFVIGESRSHQKSRVKGNFINRLEKKRLAPR